MATGLTYSVMEGKTTFLKFILECARCIGYLAIMRDEPFSAPIPDKFEPSDYHKIELAKAKCDLKKAEKMTLKTATKLAEKEYKQSQKAHKEDIQRTNQTRKNYEAMLRKVSNWKPPTQSHRGLKSFMIEQLEESIEHDCTFSLGSPKKMTGKQYRARHIKDAKWGIAYHKTEWAAEVKGAKKRTEWVQALKKALPKEE